MSNILITGGAGFIGFHLQKTLSLKYNLTSIDLLHSKSVASIERAKLLANIKKDNICNNFIDKLDVKPNVVVHLAAETGISSSLTNPKLYLETNVNGTFNVLEQCRKNGVKYLIYASSSSVYEPNYIMHENSKTENQLSFYGTTKKMCETMVENYCKQFGIVAIGLRFFTVYGSWTRPDMAAYKFMKLISEEKPVTLYNKGKVYRDFTHVSDIVKSIELLIEKIQNEKASSHQIFNIGFGAPQSIQKYAEIIAENLQKKLQINFEKLPSNELSSTNSDSSKLFNFIGYKPLCNIENGITEMTKWFKNNNYE